MKGITEKQRNILTFIGEFVERENMAPSVYEIADFIGIKTSTIFAHLRALQRKGALTRTSQARSIKLTETPQPKANDQHLIVMPLEDISGALGEMMIDRQRLGTKGEFFAYKISDDAICNLGIFCGDVVIIRQSDVFNDGDIVAVKIGEETQILTAYSKPQGKIELRPANPDFTTQTYIKSQITIRGVIVALQREY